MHLLTSYTIIQLVHIQTGRYHTAITTSEGTLQGILDHLQPCESTNSSPFELHMPAETVTVEKGLETK